MSDDRESVVATYDLYLESGPKRRKTMVHVIALAGCVATGPTTDEALAATPEAIRQFLRFLARHGEPVDPIALFETRVAEHVTEGEWLGNGSPSVVYPPDLEPISDEEIALMLRRVEWICGELAGWAETRSDVQLDAAPVGKGRTAGAILLHVLGAQGGSVSAALGGSKGFHALHGAAERGEVAIPEALRRSAALLAERVWAAPPEERRSTVPRSSRNYTLRKALRRTAEHAWEHLAELARRPDGPAL